MIGREETRSPAGLGRAPAARLTGARAGRHSLGTRSRGMCSSRWCCSPPLSLPFPLRVPYCTDECVVASRFTPGAPQVLLGPSCAAEQVGAGGEEACWQGSAVLAVDPADAAQAMLAAEVRAVPSVGALLDFVTSAAYQVLLPPPRN